MVIFWRTHSNSYFGDMTVRYAVLMKVHYWDDFVERRFRHLQQHVKTGDVYIFVDQTHGAVGSIPYDKVIRATERDVEGVGLLQHPPGKVFWYNADYPLLLLYAQKASYDYYLMCEYDAVINVDVDDVVKAAASDRADYVACPLTNKSHWTETCEGVYPENTILYNWLNAISLHSRRSVDFLLQRRRQLTQRFKSGDITNWPYSEPFIATEMHNNGFVTRELSSYGKMEQFDWWPPNHERNLPSLQDQAFLHPILDEGKYVASCLRYARLQSYFLPKGQLRRLLKQSTSSSLSLMSAFVSEAMRRIRRRAFASG